MLRIKIGALLFCITCIFFISAGAQSYDYEWFQTYSWEHILGVALNNSGEMFITGAPFHVDHMDENANVLNTVAGTDAAGSDIAVDSQGNIVVTGYFMQVFTLGDSVFTSDVDVEIFLIKFDPDLNILWARQTHGVPHPDELFFENRGRNVVVDPEDNILVSGIFERTTMFGDTSLTTTRKNANYLMKYDGDGNFQWVRTFGAGAASYLNTTGLAVDDFGNGYVVGMVTLDATIGDSTTVGTNDEDIVVCKFDPDGDVEWFHRFGGVNEDIGWDIECDHAGNILICGGFSDTTTINGVDLVSEHLKDGFLVKLDSDGHIQWAQTVPGPQFQWIAGVTEDYENNLVCVGGFYTAADFGSFHRSSRGMNDGFIAGLDTVGNFLWVKCFGGPDDDRGDRVVLRHDGDLIVNGWYGNMAIFGDTMLLSSNYRSDFFTRLHDPNLVEVTIRSFDLARSSTGIQLSWEVSSEEFIEGFRILRSSSNQPEWVVVANPGRENRSYMDRDILLGIEYRYTLVVVGRDGKEFYSQEKRITPVALDLSLGQNIPNPFNPLTRIQFVLPADGVVDLSVFDIEGKFVSNLAAGKWLGGGHTVVWNGSNDIGTPVSSGIYFYRLKFNGRELTRKMLLLR